mgnify:CR=1 FL=1
MFHNNEVDISRIPSASPPPSAEIVSNIRGGQSLGYLLIHIFGTQNKSKHKSNLSKGGDCDSPARICEIYHQIRRIHSHFFIHNFRAFVVAP